MAGARDTASRARTASRRYVGGPPVSNVSCRAGWATAPAVRSPSCHSATWTAQLSRGGSGSRRAVERVHDPDPGRMQAHVCRPCPPRGEHQPPGRAPARSSMSSSWAARSPALLELAPRRPRLTHGQEPLTGGGGQPGRQRAPASSRWAGASKAVTAATLRPVGCPVGPCSGVVPARLHCGSRGEERVDRCVRDRRRLQCPRRSSPAGTRLRVAHTPVRTTVRLLGLAERSLLFGRTGSPNPGVRAEGRCDVRAGGSCPAPQGPTSCRARLACRMSSMMNSRSRAPRHIPPWAQGLGDLYGLPESNATGAHCEGRSWAQESERGVRRQNSWRSRNYRPSRVKV